jgi:hypothetical protein
MSNNNSTSTKNVSFNKTILLLGSLIIIAAAVITIVLLMRPKASAQLPTSNSPVGNLVIDENNVSAIQEEMEQKVAAGMFETYMNTTWTFQDGKSASSDAVMGNSVNNQYAFWYDVVLNENSDVVYSSSLLPVGSVTKEIILSKNLKEGEYPATIKIHMVDENNNPIDSEPGFNIKLIVKNTVIA